MYIYVSQAKNYSNEPNRPVVPPHYHHPGSERIHLSTEEEDGGGTFDSDSVLLGFLLRFFGRGKIHIRFGQFLDLGGEYIVNIALVRHPQLQW